MREHNIQNIAHLSYYTNANGLLLVVLKKRGSGNISLELLGVVKEATAAELFERAEAQRIAEAPGACPCCVLWVIGETSHCTCVRC